MDTAIRVRILDETDCISHSTNTKGISAMWRLGNPIILSPAMEGITNNYKTWNHLTVCKQMNSILFRCHLQTIRLKSKIKITDKLISHISYIFIWMCAGKWLVHIQDCLTVQTDQVNRMIYIGWDTWNHLAVKKNKLELVENIISRMF